MAATGNDSLVIYNDLTADTSSKKEFKKHLNGPDPTECFKTQWTVQQLAAKKYLKTSCYINCAVF